MRSSPSMLGLLTVSILISGSLFAQDDSKRLERENAELRSLVERLEGKVDNLSVKVDTLEGEASEFSAELLDTRIDTKLDELIATSLSPVATGQTKKGYGITFYGFFKADFSYDTGRANTGNFARWVDQGGGSDSQTNITARQTRIGFDVDGPDEGNIKVNGKFEFDFYNGGPENKNVLQMRHAYATIHFKSQDITVLAGQTSDIVSPLFAPTVQYTGLWWMGDFGFRRPQIRVTKGLSLGEGQDLDIIFGITRNIGSTDSLGLDSGEAGAVPTFQARLDYAGKLIAGHVSRFGIYGHYGTQDYATPNGSTADLDTYSVGIFIDIRITKDLKVLGEGYIGSNIGSLLAALGQNISTGDPNSPREIDTIGGWIAVSFAAREDLSLNAGIGTDDPDNDDLTVGQRSSNFVFFTNAKYNVATDAQVGLELMWLETGYFGGGADDAFRIQTSFTFFF